MKRRLRPGAFLLSVLLFAWLCLPSAAITPQYTPSSAYQRSTYYQSLSSLPQTGDGAFDTVAAALSQLGYHEGNGTADFGGKNKNGNRNFTEYNFALGKIGGSYGYAWCAAFVSWCLQQAGEADSAGGAFASCTLWIDALRALGRYSTRASGYTPKAGDLIFFRSSGVSRASDHVGLVRYVSAGKVYTVEGNSSGKVALREYRLSDSYIVGYGKPQYKGESLGIKRTQHEDSAAGWYVVSYDFLNLRAERSAASAKKGTLQHGELVQLSEIAEGWGALEREGKTVYVSLDYADFVAPIRYSVKYFSEGSLLHSSEFYSTQSPAVAAFTPVREGHVFLHWQAEDGNEYQASEALPIGNIELRAVYEVLPAPTPPESEQEVLPPMAAPPALPLPEGNAPVISAPESPQPLAARHAGVVSAVLALTLALCYAARRRRE